MKVDDDMLINLMDFIKNNQDEIIVAKACYDVFKAGFIVCKTGGKKICKIIHSRQLKSVANDNRKDAA